MKASLLPYFILPDDLRPILRRIGLPLMAALCLGSALPSCQAQATPVTRPLSNSLAADETRKSARTSLAPAGKNASQSGSALSTTRPIADRKAEALLEKLAARTKALKSLSATITVTSTGTENGKARTPGVSKGVLRLQRPNFAYYSVSGDPPDLTACDGKTLTTFLSADTGQQIPTGRIGENITASSNPFVNYFFTQEPDWWSMIVDDAEQITRCLPDQKIAGVPVQVVELHLVGEFTRTQTLYIGPDGLLCRWDTEMISPKGDKSLYVVTFSDVQIDQQMPPASFAFTPPKEVKIQEGGDGEADLLLVGEKAPDFTLPTLDGRQMTLSETLKGHRATLVDFWFWRCLPCQEELPRLQALYDEFKAKGLNILTVNVEDTPQDLRKKMLDNKQIQEKPFTLPILFDKHSEDAFNLKFGVDVGPTNFILDENGKVLFRMASFSDKRIRRALRKLGIQ